MAVYSENSAHRANVLAAENVKQGALVGVNQSQANAAHIAYYRTVLASAKANGIDVGETTMALQALGTGGT